MLFAATFVTIVAAHIGVRRTAARLVLLIQAARRLIEGRLIRISAALLLASDVALFVSALIASVLISSILILLLGSRVAPNLFVVLILIIILIVVHGRSPSFDGSIAMRRIATPMPRTLGYLGTTSEAIAE